MSSPRLRLFRRVALVAGFVLLAGLAAACGGGGDGGTAEAASTDESITVPATDGAVVRVEDSSFEPSKVEIEAGQSVTWKFVDRAVSHNVVAKDKSFSSPLKRSGTFVHTFDEPGTYSYRCTLHPQMAGTVTVT